MASGDARQVEGVGGGEVRQGIALEIGPEDLERILALALPKIGLAGEGSEVYLADIGIPPELYARLGLHHTPLFAHRD